MTATEAVIAEVLRLSGGKKLPVTQRDYESLGNVLIFTRNKDFLKAVDGEKVRQETGYWFTTGVAGRGWKCYMVVREKDSEGFYDENTDNKYASDEFIERVENFAK